MILKTGNKKILLHADCRGMTLIELIIVLSIIAILMTLAVPAYTSHSLRVHRSEAIRLLLQTSICQEHVYASTGSYDTHLCMPASEFNRYQLAYQPANSQSQSYMVIATPIGAQTNDACGSLSLNQSGFRGISVAGMSVSKCWNGR